MAKTWLDDADGRKVRDYCTVSTITPMRIQVRLPLGCTSLAAPYTRIFEPAGRIPRPNHLLRPPDSLFVRQRIVSLQWIISHVNARTVVEQELRVRLVPIPRVLRVSMPPRHCLIRASLFSYIGDGRISNA